MADTKAIVATMQAAAIKEIKRLNEDPKGWEILTKDLPPAILEYTLHEIESGKKLNDIRRGLGLYGALDPRWRKIMATIKASFRIDATATFAANLHRSEGLLNQLTEMIQDMFDSKRPMQKFALEGLRTLSKVQLEQVQLGKELGVFQDASERNNNQGGQGMTVIVQTNVPLPSKEAILVHQQKTAEKNKELLELHRPKEKES